MTLRINGHSVRILACFALGLFVSVVCHADNTPKSASELPRLILRSQHLGAHGMGYGERSLIELSEKIVPVDIPVLLDPLGDGNLRVGVYFALASQCDAANSPVREAANQHKMDFLEAQDVLDSIANFRACSPEAQQKAVAMRADLDTLRIADQARIAEESKRNTAEDARIMQNGLKMLDPQQASILKRKEREEVYHRSLKAKSLHENGPLTPQQKELVDRMRRTMVLGEPGNPKPQ